MQAGGLQAVADMGGSILTGIDGNPLAVLAKQLHIPMHDIETLQVPLYLADGTTPPKFLDEQVSKIEGPWTQGKVRGLAAFVLQAHALDVHVTTAIHTVPSPAEGGRALHQPPPADLRYSQGRKYAERTFCQGPTVYEMVLSAGMCKKDLLPGSACL